MPYADPDKRKAYQRAYAKTWAHKNKERMRETARVYYRKNTARRKEQMRWAQLKRLYGVTQDQFEQLWALQQGRCAVCKNNPLRNRTPKNLFVDHCHHTGRVRGLLCGWCNAKIERIQNYLGLDPREFEGR